MIYRDTTYTDKYRVCYFTELDEHNKESEINKAFAGEPFYDGFIKNFKKDKAKEIIDKFLERLNNGENIEPSQISKALDEFITK
jgi:2-oxo-4-hydroxy-4-carboxy--5-ureidoimidazoline (OHCU) decarboxylase